MPASKPAYFGNGTLADVRKYIGRHPWTPGNFGKGFITPTGRVITWSTRTTGRLIFDHDAWPAHIDGMRSMGYAADAYNDFWREDGSTFSVDPQGEIYRWYGRFHRISDEIRKLGGTGTGGDEGD